MPRAVQFDQYGDVDLLHIADVKQPTPGPHEVQVRVIVAGTNPGEIAIRTGAMDSLFPAIFPSGQGTDFAGVVAATGSDVTGFAAGDEVLGWTDDRAAQANYVVVPDGQLVAKPAKLSWEVAGGLFVIAATARATVESVGPKDGETVVVSAAAGGVGGVSAQLAKLRGAHVIGIASESNAEWLTSIGVTPVAYGDGLLDRIRQAAPNGVDAFIDTHGSGYVDQAIDLGVPADRVDTIIDFEGAQRHHGVHTDGMSMAARADVLAEVASLVASGAITVPIDATYPLDDVREAYNELAKGHTRGKIVLTVSPA